MTKPPETKEPREFWIQDEWTGPEGDVKCWAALEDNDGFINPSKSIHVIEYSAVEALRAENIHLKSAHEAEIERLRRLLNSLSDKPTQHTSDSQSDE